MEIKIDFGKLHPLFQHWVKSKEKEKVRGTCVESTFHHEKRYLSHSFYKPISRIRKALNVLKSFFFILTWLAYNNGFTQNELPNPYKKYDSDRNFYKTYNYLKNNEQGYISSEYRRTYFDIMSVFMSWMKNFSSAIAFHDSLSKSIKPGGYTSINQYNKRDAAKYIDSLAINNRIIIINEGHYSSMNRYFVSELLDPLSKRGFKYLAIEALSDVDTLINIRKFPLQFTSGFYTNEPFFGMLIRKAIALGYTLMSYESILPNQSQLERENAQAQNIYKQFINIDSTAKLLILCGYGHVYEKEIYESKYMAAFLKEITGIDPITIDQEIGNEHSCNSYENIFYRTVVDSIGIISPSIIIKPDSQIWSMFTDIVVFHPRTTYKKGQPSWLNDTSLKSYPIPHEIMSRINQKVLLRAYIAEEGNKAVPIDQFELNTTSEEPPNLLLYPGKKYLIQLVDVNGNFYWGNTYYFK